MKDKVGPGHPPRGGRFVKGKSGNPKGRPKKVREDPVSAFDIIIDSTLTVTQGGVEREVSAEEALQLRTYQDAIAGNRAARREVLKWIAKREQAIAERIRLNAPPIPQLIEPDPDNANQALLLLGIASPDAERQSWTQEYEFLLLEPWAVQEAKSRRRGRQPLTDEEMNEVNRCTRKYKYKTLS